MNPARSIPIAIAGAAILASLSTVSPIPQELLKLLPADGTWGLEFGTSCSVFGTRAAIGAPA